MFRRFSGENHYKRVKALKNISTCMFHFQKSTRQHKECEQFHSLLPSFHSTLQENFQAGFCILQKNYFWNQEDK